VFEVIDFDHSGTYICQSFSLIIGRVNTAQSLPVQLVVFLNFIYLHQLHIFLHD